ncbi:MAG: general secretion pathway protein GspK [Armatimonadetes bacterium]|nr:general secretion pathway protein GspK [Armatimonadota bacterium]
MKKGREGFILVEILVVIACLMALMAMLTQDQRAALQETQDRLRQRRAEIAMRSAVARALAALENADPNLVTLQDEWALLGDGGSEGFNLGDAAFRLEIIDAGSLVNINQASEEHLRLLPIDTEPLESLLDWRETGLTARPDGAKDEYYNGLAQPYNARLGSLETLNELLLIRGWTARMLYRPPDETLTTAASLEDEDGDPLPLAAVLTVSSGAPNTRATGEARVNIGQGGVSAETLAQLGLNPQLALQVAAGAPYTSFRQLWNATGLTPENMQPLLDALAFSAGTRLAGKININTALPAVLKTLPEMTSDIAEAIVSRQASGFGSLGELTSVPGLSGALLADIADLCAVGSDTWIVRAYGESGGVGAAAEVTVRWTEGRAQIQAWERFSDSGIPAWWDWDEEPTTTIEAGALES